jgi:hypothetical protein
MPHKCAAGWLAALCACWYVGCCCCSHAAEAGGAKAGADRCQHVFATQTISGEQQQPHLHCLHCCLCCCMYCLSCAAACTASAVLVCTTVAYIAQAVS